MSTLNLTFKPVDLQRHADLCLQFVADTHFCSFGSMDGFADEEEQTPQHFIERIAAKLAVDPESCLHVWNDNSIIGQLNFGTFIDPAIGYLSFFYVTPLWRGTDVAAEMEEFAAGHFVKRGYHAACLSVTSANVRAIKFYLKQGWKDLGPRQDRPITHNMEKIF